MEQNTNPNPMPAPVQPVPPAPLAPTLPAPTPQMNPSQATPPIDEVASPNIPIQPGVQQVVLPPVKKGGSAGKFIFFLILIILLVGGGIGGYYYYINYSIKSETPESMQETSQSLDSIPIADSEISGEPEIVNYEDKTYGFSLDYLSSWDFECQNCNTLGANVGSPDWIILNLKTFDYQIDEDGNIVTGANMIIRARSTDNGSLSIDSLVSDTSTGFSNYVFNGISGAVNLDPSRDFQEFIYHDDSSGLDIQLSWKSVTSKDRADQELQTILKSFKKI